MQLFALDTEKQLVLAAKAKKGTDYFCRECNGLVRARSGPHRHPHFYHFSSDSECRQNGKSLEHLQVQLLIHQKLRGEAEIEVRFDSINRIADVVWFKEKIIFEVQCSPILAKEVLMRNSDYQKLGFTVVWLLHTRTFLKSRATAAEMALFLKPHYFTDIDENGKGEIFDQTSGIFKARREMNETRYPIAIDKPFKIRVVKHTSKLFQQRSRRGLYFKGDIHDLLMSGAIAIPEELCALKVYSGPSFQNSISFLKRWSTILYRFFLEKCLS